MANSSPVRIGALLWWHIPSDAQFSRNDLIANARKYGIGDRYIPEQISFISAFKRGIAEIKTSTDRSQGILLREIKERGGSKPTSNSNSDYKVAVVKEEASFRRSEVSHLQLGTVTANRTLETIESHPAYQINKEQEELFQQTAEEVRAAYRRALLYNADDLRRMLSRFADLCAVSLRRSGGVYFVPEQYCSDLENFKKFIYAVGGGAAIQIDILPQYMVNAEDIVSLRRVAQEVFQEEVKNLQEASVSLLQDMKDTKISQVTKAKRESLAKKVEGFDEQRQRIEAFSETLQLESEGLLQQIAELRQTLEPDVKRLGIPSKPVTKVVPKLREVTKVEVPTPHPIPDPVPSSSPQQREIDQMLADLGGLADLLKV